MVVYLNMVFTSFSQSVSHSQSVIQSGVGHLKTLQAHCYLECFVL